MAHIRILDYDVDSSEAILEITPTISVEERSLFNKSDDPMFSLISFAYSFNPLNYERDISLFGFLVTNIIREDYMRPPSKIDEGFFSYHMYAKVMNSHERHVRLGDIDIFLDIPLPKDIANNELVSFDVHRLDFYLNRSDCIL